MKSKTLLCSIGALVIKHKNSPLSCRQQLLVRLKRLYTIYLEMRKQEEVEKIWVRDIFLEDQRSEQGASHNLLNAMREKDREKYYNFLRMYPETFDELLEIIEAKIAKKNFLRQSVSPRIRLELTLRYLASGDSMTSISYLFRVGKNTVSDIIAETCQALWDSLKDIVFVKPTEQNWKKIAHDFDVKWNFKNCIGAIDGKHIVIQAPPHSGSNYYNYKGTHSINLLAIADANYKFIMVDIGAEGRKSDSGIFRNSNLGQGFEHKQFNIPSPLDDLPFVLVADEAFPLTEYMMRPYPRRGNLDIRKKVFNYRLSRARRIVESSFGILSSVFRIFRKPIIASETTVRKIVQASVCLHNFLLTKRQLSVNRQISQESGNSEKSSSEGLIDFGRTGANIYTKNASRLREKFANYFCGEGSVDWQWQKALQNDF